MIKKINSLIFLVLLTAGCASLQFPAYVLDKNPYTQQFFAGHAEVLEAVNKSLGELGWQLEGTADPSMYEQSRFKDPDSQDILLYTQVRQTPMFFWTTYVRLNVLVHSKNKISNAEIRYAKVNSFPFKQFKSFRNDRLVKRIFQHIADHLNQS